MLKRATSAVRLVFGWATIVSAAVAASFVVAAVVSGTLDASNTTLLFMGFDADRAQMITSLMIASAAAAASTLVANRSGRATLAGVVGFGALFGRAFLIETRNAITAPGIDHSFSPIGWLLTVLTLATAAFIASWAGAVLARALRPGLIAAGSVVRDALRNRRPNRRLLGRPVAVAATVILLVVTLPVFGDMVNYIPDSRMLHGGAPADLSLAGPDSGAPNGRPWLAWRPSGSGSVSSVQLPALTGESSSPMEDVSIYTPPGYDAKGARRYPVLYEAPFPYNLWDSSINVRVALDTMIDRGIIPAMIVVFINAWRPPTDCANALDCKHWLDTFIGGTVVSYVDANYLTLHRAASRAIAGFSEGGYLAPTLALRHPDTFGAAIAISGYFGDNDGGMNAWRPFGSDPADLAAASPKVVATQLPAADRAKLFFIVVAQPRQVFFGNEATDFERLLAREGYGYKAIDANVGHGWDQVRQTLPVVLETWAARLVAMGAL